MRLLAVEGSHSMSCTVYETEPLNVNPLLLTCLQPWAERQGDGKTPQQELEKLVPLLWKDVSFSPLTEPQYAGNSCSPERCCQLVVHV